MELNEIERYNQNMMIKSVEVAGGNGESSKIKAQRRLRLKFGILLGEATSCGK